MPEFIASDRARLFFRDSGDGPTLICLHGLTRNGADFDVLRQHLPGVRLIAPDARGRGNSEQTGAASYNLARECEDVLNLLDHLAIPASAFLGTSRGGMAAMALAARAPERILGLCLNDIGPEMEPDGRMRLTTYVGLQPSEHSIEARVAAMPRLNAGFVGVPADRWRDEVRRHFVETAEGLRITHDPALRDAFMATLDRAPNLWHGFDALAGKPVAVIRGANSDILSRRIVEAMALRRPDLIRAEVPDRGHMPFLDEPESLAVLRAFLAAVAAGG